MNRKTGGSGSKTSRISKGIFIAGLLCFGASAGIAQAADLPLPSPPPAPILPTASDPVTAYFLGWYDRVHEAQATQPGWMTPLVTVTPRLEEEFRYDQFFQDRADGAQTAVFDGGKGLELIPTTTNEVLINLPAYQDRTVASVHQGTTDWNFLTVKQRLLSANEENGNYILTAFFGVTAPTGAPAFTNKAWIFTPTLAGGKGWGDFDIQATTSVAIPGSYKSTLGTSWATNVTFQYHFAEFFWPEIEVNDTYWFDGSQRGGLNQTFITPGIIFGRFTLANAGPTTIKGIIGIGYQFAASPTPAVLAPEITPQYNHEVLLTARVTF